MAIKGEDISVCRDVAINIAQYLGDPDFQLLGPEILLKRAEVMAKTDEISHDDIRVPKNGAVNLESILANLVK